LLSTSNASAQTISAFINPDSTTAVPGDLVSVLIVIDMSEYDQLLGSFTGSLSWNPAVLEYQSNSGLLSGYTGLVSDANAVTSGQIFFNGVNITGKDGEIEILEITFKVGLAGTTLDLDFSAMAAAFTFTDLLPELLVTDAEIIIDDTIIFCDGGDIIIGVPIVSDTIAASGTLTSTSTIGGGTVRFQSPVQIALESGSVIDFNFSAVIDSCH